MSNESILTLCYNKGCGKKFNPSENEERSCQYHPGQPVFHDAYKSWGCCNKRVTDFTEFLNIPGCTQSYHSSEKPLPVDQPEREEEVYKDEVISTEQTVKSGPVKLERPPSDTPMLDLNFSVSSTLKVAIERKLKEMNITHLDNQVDKKDGTVKEGTSCKNNSCTKTYIGESSNEEDCCYHPGVPIFHEGMKYWSCCQRKTTDFDNFLKQEGCSHSKHVWVKAHEDVNVSSCRYDMHETITHVILTLYAKNPNPDSSHIRANPVTLKIYVMYDENRKLFDKAFILRGIIDTENCAVSLSPSKVEIKLKKAEAVMWKQLEL